MKEITLIILSWGIREKFEVWNSEFAVVRFNLDLNHIRKKMVDWALAVRVISIH